MDANEDGEEIVLYSDTDEPAADNKKEELLRLRNGSLLSDYVSKMNLRYKLSLGMTIVDVSIQGIETYLALLAKEANKVFHIM